MTQQPFTRPGAVDLSGLKRPAPGAGQTSAGSQSAGGGAPVGGRSAYSVDVSEENFQSLLETSVTAPVVLVFYSPSRVPESTAYADEVAAAIEAYDGRFLAGLVDIDASPEIAQTLQIPQVPLLMVILEGRPAAQPIPGVLKRDEVDTLLNQLAQGLTAQGITSRHQPLSAAPPAEGEAAEEQVDPRYAAAQQALENDDIDGAVAEYQRLVDANPADAEAAAGLAMAKVLQRTHGVDLNSRPRGGGREARRRGGPDPGRRPGPARRRTSTTRSRASSTWSGVPPATSATAPASTWSACSQPSATTIPGCCAAGRTSRRRSSEAALMSTIVYCHAHPDDEASQTSGAMARASAEGHRVVVVFATNGDHGEVAADAVEGESVAEYRRREAEASAAALGLARDRLARVRRLRDERLGAERRRGFVLPSRPRRGGSPAGRRPRRGGRRRPGRLRLARRLRPSRPREGAPPRPRAPRPLARRTPRLLESTFNRTDMWRMVDEARAAGVDRRTSRLEPRRPDGRRQPPGQHRGRDHLGGRRLGLPRRRSAPRSRRTSHRPRTSSSSWAWRPRSSPAPSAASTTSSPASMGRCDAAGLSATAGARRVNHRSGGRVGLPAERRASGLRAGRPAPGTASRRRSRARPRRRSGSRPGRRRARRRRRGAGRGSPAVPAVRRAGPAARRPSTSSDSNGLTWKIPCSR